MKTKCSRPGCNNDFERLAHNMKYCSPECRQIVTQKKISDRYKRKSVQKNRQNAVCAKCKKKLSRYNQDDLCTACSYSDENGDLMQILRELS